MSKIVEPQAAHDRFKLVTAHITAWEEIAEKAYANENEALRVYRNSFSASVYDPATTKGFFDEYQEASENAARVDLILNGMQEFLRKDRSTY